VTCLSRLGLPVVKLSVRAVALTWEAVIGSATMMSPGFKSKRPLTAPVPNRCRVVNVIVDVDGSMRYVPTAGSCTAEVTSVMVGPSIGGWFGVPISSSADLRIQDLLCGGFGRLQR